MGGCLRYRSQVGGSHLETYKHRAPSEGTSATELDWQRGTAYGSGDVGHRAGDNPTTENFFHP